MQPQEEKPRSETEIRFSRRISLSKEFLLLFLPAQPSKWQKKKSCQTPVSAATTFQQQQQQ
jgi:hypothetical protein